MADDKPGDNGGKAEAGAFPVNVANTALGSKQTLADEPGSVSAAVSWGLPGLVILAVFPPGIDGGRGQ